MTREERAQELNVIRKTYPERLIGIYRAATKTPYLDQLPRGLGFTGMIEAILDHEFARATLHDELQQVTHVPQQHLISQPITPASLQPATNWRHRCGMEFRAFCSGAAM